jgi:group II intron reverse transcriptase/maturase
MRDAETVLAVIQERGKRGLPLEDIYRQLFNPDLYLRAYARLYQNEGAMTRGATKETVDGMSLAKIEKLIDDLRHERFRWTPVRRVYIEKPNSTKKRPLGVPTWTDKLLQEVLRSILEAYYEPQFSLHSHGFRPNRGCHTALATVMRTWTGTKWFIEGDISECFDSIDHDIMLSILREKLHDNRFLRLIAALLKAGYLEDWRYNQTLSGTPQGGVISPILSNIYLDRLDKFVEQVLVPANTRGKARRWSKPYEALRARMVEKRRRGEIEEARRMEKQLQTMPSGDPHDPDYRRLWYVRYADDFLLGFIGSKAEAEEIKRQLDEFMRETLKLELSTEKTLITHASTQAARFLGYEIVNQQADDKHDRFGHRSLNGRIGLRLPADAVEKRRALYRRNGKAVHRPELLADDDFTIVDRYQAEYRGVVNYYLPAQNVFWLQKLKWDMETSLLKTLARKHKSTVTKMARKYRSQIETPYGVLKCLEVKVEREGKKPLVARFGGIPLRRQKLGPLVDQDPLTIKFGRNELLKLLLADECQLCGSRDRVQVHHIRKLADLKVKGRAEKPAWIQNMAARRRKTLVVCHECHAAIHSGRLQEA